MGPQPHRVDLQYRGNKERRSANGVSVPGWGFPARALVLLLDIDSMPRTLFVVEPNADVFKTSPIRTGAEITVVFWKWGTFITCPARWNRAPLISVSVLSDARLCSGAPRFRDFHWLR